MFGSYITSRLKDGMKGSNKQARRYTIPAAVFITREQRDWFCL
jgi:hypothetical protein